MNKKNSFPDGYKIRPARMEDLGDQTELLNAWSTQFLGIEKFTLDESEMDWKTPGFNLDSDTRVVIAPGGKMVAYYEVWDLSDPHVHIVCWGRVHPGFTGLGIGSYLLEWAEERARLGIIKAPPDARVTLMAFALSIDEPSLELFRNSGFELIRHNLRMVIDLDGQPPQPQWPTGISVRSIIRGKDERAITHAVRDSFKDHWGFVERPVDDDLRLWQQRMDDDKEFDPSLWFLAMDGEQVAGISLCRLTTYDDPQMGWVGTLGVLRPWRRRGLGFALLQHSFQELYRRGKHKIGLGVDAQSLTGATQLYLKAGMHPDPNRQFCQFEKELRPGVELGTQSL
jgi:mycothiol synthase